MGKFAITSTNCLRPCARQLASSTLTPSGYAEVFDDEPSHICTGAGNAAERRLSTSAMFSPACWRPVKKSAMRRPSATETTPEVNTPVLSSSGARARCSTRMLVSSLCSTSPRATWQINSSWAGRIFSADSFAISHCVAAGRGMPRFCSSRSRR